MVSWQHYILRKFISITVTELLFYCQPHARVLSVECFLFPAFPRVFDFFLQILLFYMKTLAEYKGWLVTLSVSFLERWNFQFLFWFLAPSIWLQSNFHFNEGKEKDNHYVFCSFMVFNKFTF